MAFMRTANPALNDNTFSTFERYQAQENQMTLQGTVNKTGILLVAVVLGAAWTWRLMAVKNPAVMGWMIGGLIGGLICCIAICLRKTWAPVLSVPYALCEGLFLGGLSAYFEKLYPGIVPQAVGLTFGTLFCLLFAYKTGFIKATENFKLGVVAATGGIALLYLASFILGFFGWGIPFIHEAGWLGIGFSAFVVVIAALNLVLDFDFIENGANRGAPKYMEWYGAFGLLVTLVWLYIEILRLLSKLRSRN